MFLDNTGAQNLFYGSQKRIHPDGICLRYFKLAWAAGRLDESSVNLENPPKISKITSGPLLISYSRAAWRGLVLLARDLNKLEGLGMFLNNTGAQKLFYRGQKRIRPDGICLRCFKLAWAAGWLDDS